MDIKRNIFNYIEHNCDELLEMARFIYDNPETGMQEYLAASKLEDYLHKEGFAVEAGVGGLETAFRAVYQKGSSGPSIGLLCEYDALKGIGHACGHHMQGPAILLAACALKNAYQTGNYKLVVYGTPAEEGLGGKIIMNDNGCFNDIDIALMFHGMTATIVDIRSYAMREYQIEFFGKSSHAALFPYEGRSAFDAVLLSFNGTEFLREHVKDDTRIHYSINEPVGPANVVPDHVTAEFILRSYSQKYLNELEYRLENIVKGAALMTETTYKITQRSAYMPKVPVFKLNDLLMDNARLVDAPNIQPPIQQSGSTDFATVMYKVPGSVIRVAFAPEGAGVHSKEFLEAGKTEAANNAILIAAKILSATAYDIISNPALLKELQEEFQRNKAQMEA